MNHPQIGSALLRSDTLALNELTAFGRLIGDCLDPTALDSPLQTVLKGTEVCRSDLLDQLSERSLAGLCSCGLLVESGRYTFSPFRAHLLEGLVIVTDPQSAGRPRAPWYLDPLCEGPLLARLLIRKLANRGLDMGCGCGVLSLVMSSFCEHVTGVDINPRAIEFSRFNSALNGIRNVTFIEGDLFDCVRGQQFDLIVFNSPTNEEGFHYRDLLESGEPLLARFFSDLGDHLAPDGYGQINLAMNDYSESSFVDRLASWIRAGESNLRAVTMVCKQYKRDDGGIWKRGWATFCRGSFFWLEVDWPYHLLSATPQPLELSELVLRLLENHDLLDSRRHVAQLTWSEGLCCLLTEKQTLGLWNVPLVQVPDEIALLSSTTRPISFPMAKHLDVWIELCLRKGLLGLRPDD
jgi:methylase of polypeptide subunit release factors